jgi:HAMP domain-containing protein
MTEIQQKAAQYAKTYFHHLGDTQDEPLVAAYLAGAAEQSEEVQRLKKENERMRTAIKRALELKSLWLYSGDVKAEHLHEAFALQQMEFSLEESLK